jgi:hypothetical protein
MASIKIPQISNASLLEALQKVMFAFFFFWFGLGPIHLFEKKVNDARTHILGPVMHTLGMQ